MTAVIVSRRMLAVSQSLVSRRDGRRALCTAKGGHVRRLVTESFSAADHHVCGEPEHE